MGWGGWLIADHGVIIQHREVLHKYLNPATANAEQLQGGIHPPTRDNRLGHRSGLRYRIGLGAGRDYGVHLTVNAGRDYIIF